MPGFLVPNEQISHPSGRWRIFSGNLFHPDAGAVNEFEQAITKKTGWKHALATQSGKAGLRLILKTLAFPEGTEAFVPAYTYYGLPGIVREAGLRPVFIDVDPVAGRMDFIRAIEAWRPTVRMALHTHLFGVINPGLRQAARAFGDRTWLVEDCAHAPLHTVSPEEDAEWLGRAAFLSFDRLKLVTTIRGGMVVTHNDEFAERARSIQKNLNAPSKGKLASLVFLSELETLVRHPFFYGILGRLLALGAATEWVRQFYRRANRDFVQGDQRFSPLQAELGLRSLSDLDRRTAARRELIQAYLERLKARVESGAPREYVNRLAEAFEQRDPPPSCLIVCVDEPAVIEAEARRGGFEVLARDRITDFCGKAGSVDFPCAHHLFRHAVKLPLPDDAPRDRFLRFADRITARIADDLTPYSGKVG